MKKSILAACIVTLIFSCKKTKTNEFTQTDVTGTTTLKGNISKNIITPNGNGGWTSNTKTAAAGVVVSVKIDNNSLYPNSNAQGARVYSAATDANGNYAISVASNAGGVNAQVTVDGFTGTLDTLLATGVKAGLYSTYPGTSFSRTLYMGQNSQFDYSFVASNVATNPNTGIVIGSAIVTGSVGISILKEVTSGTLITLTTTTIPLASREVYISLSNDPNTLAPRIYKASTNSSGYYSITVSSVPAGTAGFNQNAVIWVNDFATTRDTIKANNVYKVGRPGVYQKQTLNQTGIYNSTIRNASNLTYNAFVPD